MAAEQTKRDGRRISIYTSGTENAQALLSLGILCVVASITSATGLVEILNAPVRWLLAGGVLMLLAVGMWYWRLQLVISHSGVAFLPSVFHSQFNFEWSEVRGWCWRIHPYTDTDGGRQVDREVVLRLSNGSELSLPHPYCCKELVDELTSMFGPEVNQDD